MTSTSPSNCHLGHYASLLKTDGRDAATSTTHLTTQIMRTHHQMAAICAKNGISLHRWQQIVTAMLEKETGRPKLHRLQVIHLIKADLNLLIKILIARRFVWHGEHHGIFGEGQAGSRPGLTANNIVLSKELTHDMAARTLSNVAMMEKDATVCFNRMIPSIASIIRKTISAPENDIQRRQG
jgi:hypothetical protein